MKKTLISFTLMSSFVISAEINNTSPIVHTMDRAVLQPIANYFENQAAIDLQKGVDYVEAEVNKVLKNLINETPEIRENVDYYINTQLKKDIEKLSTRGEKNIKNESDKATSKTKHYAKHQAPKDVKKQSKRGKKNAKREGKKLEKKGKKLGKKIGL